MTYVNMDYFLTKLSALNLNVDKLIQNDLVSTYPLAFLQKMAQAGYIISHIDYIPRCVYCNALYKFDKIHSKQHVCKPLGEDSFKNWPTNSRYSPDEYIKARFKYTGLSDLVYCAWCNKHYHNWAESSLTPLEVHSKCLFNKKSRKVNTKPKVAKPKDDNIETNKFCCRVCLSSECNNIHVIDPCGHVFCQNCLNNLATCPICRTNIDNTIKLFNKDQIRVQPQRMCKQNKNYTE